MTGFASFDARARETILKERNKLQSELNVLQAEKARRDAELIGKIQKILQAFSTVKPVVMKKNCGSELPGRIDKVIAAYKEILAKAEKGEDIAADDAKIRPELNAVQVAIQNILKPKA